MYSHMHELHLELAVFLFSALSRTKIKFNTSFLTEFSLKSAFTIYIYIYIRAFANLNLLKAKMNLKIALECN